MGEYGNFDMEDNYEEFAFLNEEFEEMDDSFSNKIPLLPMNQKKIVTAMEKVLSEVNSKNILISNRFLSVSEEELKKTKG